MEQLKSSDIPEVVELFNQAFKDYLLIPEFQVKPELTKMLFRAGFDLYRGIKSSMFYGIREGGHLICVSLSANSSERPSVLSLIKYTFFLIRFSISMVRAFGWRKAKKLGNFCRKVFYEERPEHKEPYLELALFGTLPEYQRQGFGRKMLHFLYDEAKKRGYKGVILVTNRGNPAFRLYLKEGFSVEKEFTIGETTLSWMRLVF